MEGAVRSGAAPPAVGWRIGSGPASQPSPQPRVLHEGDRRERQCRPIARQVPVTAAATPWRAAGALVAPALDAAVSRLEPRAARAGAPPPGRRGQAGPGRPGAALGAAAAGGAEEPTGIPGAVAIELVHNFSLIHDDIIDGDRERRHRPTVWAEFGVGPAIIAGDALATLATQVLLEDADARAGRAAAALADATQAMIAGQADDMAFETRASVSARGVPGHGGRARPGPCSSCAAAIGAVLAGAPDADVVDALADFGRHLGIAFQAVDDVLGIWGEPGRTGKPVGSDLRPHKKTLPVVDRAGRSDGPGRPSWPRCSAAGSPTPTWPRRPALIEATGARDAVMAHRRGAPRRRAGGPRPGAAGRAAPRRAGGRSPAS